MLCVCIYIWRTYNFAFFALGRQYRHNSVTAKLSVLRYLLPMKDRSIQGMILKKIHCRLEVWCNTVDSRYLEIKGTIINTSRYPYFDISWLCNLTPLIRNIYWKYCGKGEKLLPRSNFSSFLQYFVTWFSISVLKQGPDFLFELVMRLFEITEVEITRVDCISFLNLKQRDDAVTT